MYQRRSLFDDSIGPKSDLLDSVNVTIPAVFTISRSLAGKSVG
jgi:hypothetical protein